MHAPYQGRNNTRRIITTTDHIIKILSGDIIQQCENNDQAAWDSPDLFADNTVQSLSRLQRNEQCGECGCARVCI